MASDERSGVVDIAGKWRATERAAQLSGDAESPRICIRWPARLSIQMMARYLSLVLAPR